MVGYAVGETIKPSAQDEIEDLEDSNRELIISCPPAQKTNCYEVVTAWVHPRYNGYTHAHTTDHVFLKELVP